VQGRPVALVAVALALLLVAAGCGGSTSASTTTQAATATATTTTAAASRGATTTTADVSGVASASDCRELASLSTSLTQAFGGDPAKLMKAVQSLDQPKLAQASQNIGAWVQKNCTHA